MGLTCTGVACFWVVRVREGSYRRAAASPSREVMKMERTIVEHVLWNICGDNVNYAPLHAVTSELIRSNNISLSQLCR